MLYRRVVLVCLILSSPYSYSQVQKKIRQYERTFQFSLFPGISTNGIYSGSYYNKFSLNLFGGLSAGNQILELSPISSINIKSSTGIQLAGLANIVGANAFINLSLREERDLINEEGFESNSKGIQGAGFLNYVRDNVTGIQVGGILNIVGRDFKGSQIAGIGNNTGGTTDGMQLAGLYNLSFKSVGGFQISSLFNYTNGQLSGSQLGLFNKAARIKGRKSTPPTRARGLQLGLLNMSKETDGVQIALVNFGGDTRGVQIGLINFFNSAPSKEKVRMGTPIGLLNFGSKGSYMRLYYDEIYPANIEYTTGNCVNCSWVLYSEMPFDDNNQLFNQNALILGWDYFNDTWGFGYGFQRVLYNKATIMPSPKNKVRVMNYGFKFLHLNRSMSFDKTFNLLTRLNFDYGKKWRSLYVFAGVSLNYFLLKAEDGDDVYKIRSAKISMGNVGNLNSEFWPGYSVGFQF